MILKINNGNNITTVKTLLKISSGSSKILVEWDGDDKITLTNTETDYETWYNKLIARKLNAMLMGGCEKRDNSTVSTEDQEVDYIYNFNTGLQRKSTAWLKSIEGVEPTDDNNIQLIPGLTLDIVPHEESSKIVFSRIELEEKTVITDILNDINICVWYLYHTFNSFLYRLNVWDPNTFSRPMFKESRLLGTIAAYQATVAAWNIKLWRKSFLWEMSPVRENVSFSIGYMAIGCINPNVTCKVVIKNLKKTIGAAERNDSTKFLTIYAQGVSSNKSDMAIRTIEKESSGKRIQLGGTGTDDMVSSKEDWDNIVITINLGEMSQGDYYKAAFSLAVGQSEDTASYYVGSDSIFNQLTVETTWLIDEERCGFVTNIDIPALVMRDEEDEDYLK